jgi:hypothetical protein
VTHRERIQLTLQDRQELYLRSIKPVRNVLRRYRYESVLAQILDYLALEGCSDTLQTLKRLPWIAERLAIFVLRDEPSLYGNDYANRGVIEHCVDQAMAQIDGKVFRLDNVSLGVRELMLRQLPYQSGHQPTLAHRQLTFIRQLNRESPAYRELSETWGTDALTASEICSVLYLATANSQRWDAYELVKNFRDPYVDTLVRCLNLLSPTVYQLRANLKAKFDLDQTKNTLLDEWYRPLPLIESPCVITNQPNGQIMRAWGLPTLIWYFENRVAIETSRYPEKRFSEAFRDWLEAEVGRIAKRHFSNTKSAKEFGLSQSEKNADFVIPDGDFALVVEVKAKHLSTVTALAEPRLLKRNLASTVVKAEEQTKETAHAISSQFSKTERLVVTASDLFLPTFLAFTEHGSEHPNLVLSIDNFEILMHACSSGITTLKDFFNEARSQQSDPITKVLTSSQLLLKSKFNPARQARNLSTDALNDFEQIARTLLKQ